MWPENWDAWLIFCDVAHQWRTTAQGWLLGLDMAAIMPYLALITTERDAQRELWQHLCHIASGVIQAQADMMSELNSNQRGSL